MSQWQHIHQHRVWTTPKGRWEARYEESSDVTRKRTRRSFVFGCWLWSVKIHWRGKKL